MQTAPRTNGRPLRRNSDVIQAQHANTSGRRSERLCWRFALVVLRKHALDPAAPGSIQRSSAQLFDKRRDITKPQIQTLRTDGRKDMRRLANERQSPVVQPSSPSKD